MNWDSINVFISILRLLKDIQITMRPRACNFLLALLQMEETEMEGFFCASFKFLSEASPIDTSVGVLELKSKLHFPDLTLR